MVHVGEEMIVVLGVACTTQLVSAVRSPVALKVTVVPGVTELLGVTVNPVDTETLMVADALSPVLPVIVTVYGPEAPAPTRNWVPSSEVPRFVIAHDVEIESPVGLELSVHEVSPLLKAVPETRLTYTVVPGMTGAVMIVPG